MTPIQLPRFFPYRLSILEQRVSQMVARHYQQQFGLSRTEWRVLATLAMHDTMSASEITQFTLLEKMPVSRAIARLRQARLILQKQSRQDKRLCLLSLSAKGKQTYQKIAPEVLQEEQRLLSILTETERKQLDRIMQKLEKGLNAIV